MPCATSCKTQDHRTYGECLRSKGLSTAAGETTKASGPTRPNDALTAKATHLPGCKRCGREECASIHMTVDGHDYVHPSDPDWFPCAQHAPTAHPSCPYSTTTTHDMIRATTSPADLR